MNAFHWRWFGRRWLGVLGLAALLAIPGSGGAQDPAPPGPTVRFSLNSAEGRRGQVVTLTLSVFTDVPLRSISVAVNFDESRVRLLETRRLLELGVAFADEVRSERIDNRDRSSGDQTLEGFVLIELSTFQENGQLALAVGDATPIVELDFGIREDAPLGVTEIRFTNIGPVPELGPAVIFTNAFGGLEDRAAPPQDAAVLGPDDFDHGTINIIGEVGFFMRGDTDLNCKRDISDPIRTIEFLFRGGLEPRCLDAADANDSGTLDLSDPVFTLLWLYRGGSDFSEPYATVGKDPTDDQLDCADGLERNGCMNDTGGP